MGEREEGRAACVEHPDREAKPCLRCGTFRCPECLDASGRCSACGRWAGARAPTEESLAGFFPRLGARLVDFLVLTAVGALAGVVGGLLFSPLFWALNLAVRPGGAGQSAAGLVLTLGGGAAYLGAVAIWGPRCGASPGKALLGLRVVTLEGRRPGVGRAIGRELGLVLDLICSGLPGLVAYLFSPLRQRFGDRVAGTLVVRAASLDPTFAPTSAEVREGLVRGLAVYLGWCVVAMFLGVALQAVRR